MSSNLFAAANLTVGQLNAIVKKLGGEQRALMFLRGELTLTDLASRWYEKKGVIYLSVTSDGTTGKEWIQRLQKKGYGVDAIDILKSPDFQPTNGVTTDVAIIRGQLFSDKDRTTKNIFAEAVKHNFGKINAEVACLIREIPYLIDTQGFGYSGISDINDIIIMHEPIKDVDGNPSLLTVHSCYEGAYLERRECRDNDPWFSKSGFAFAVPQTEAE